MRANRGSLRRFGSLFIAVAFLSNVLLGCASAPPAPAKKREAGPLSVIQPEAVPPQAPASGQAQEEEGEYRIGVGDLLEISLYRPDIRVQDDMRRQVLVRPDGKVSYFFIGDVRARGLTTEELRERITKGLSQYIRSPEVAVIVVGSSKKRVYVAGEVVEQGMHELKGGQGDTLLDAIFLSKGLTKKAGIEKVYVIRRDSAVAVDLGEVLLKGDRSKNVVLMSEDVVYVPEAAEQRVFVVGYVRRPNAFEVSRPIRLTEAIALAEDFSLGARRDSVQIIRGGLPVGMEPRQVMTVNMNDIRRGLADDVYVQRGDIVFVPSTLLAKWNEILTQLLPSLQALFIGTIIEREASD